MLKGKECENDDLNCRAANARSDQDAIPIIKYCETIIQRQKRNILGVPYTQGCVFNRFKNSNKFLDIIKKSGISILTINFKMNLTKILDRFPKLKKSSMSLYFFKGYAKSIKEICKESEDEFR